jgi:C-terminal, D2-small domain, of ClpB protein
MVLTARCPRCSTDVSRAALQVMTDAALDHVVKAAYDPQFGARPLRRWLEHHVVTELSRMIVAGDLPDSSVVTVDAGPGGLTFSVEVVPEEDNGGGTKGTVKRARVSNANAARWDVEDELMDDE